MSCLAGPRLSVLRHSCYREYNVGDTLEYEVRAPAILIGLPSTERRHMECWLARKSNRNSCISALWV